MRPRPASGQRVMPASHVCAKLWHLMHTKLFSPRLPSWPSRFVSLLASRPGNALHGVCYGVATLALLAPLCFVSCAYAQSSPQSSGFDSANSTPELRFRDIFKFPAGPRGLEPSATVLALQGQRVRITGYMVAQQAPPTGRFFLTPRPLHMSEEADGDADDLPPNTVVVLMPAAQQQPLPHTPGLLQLTGTLLYGRHQLSDGRVVWLRLQLDPREPAAPRPPAS